MSSALFTLLGILLPTPLAVPTWLLCLHTNEPKLNFLHDETPSWTLRTLFHLSVFCSCSFALPTYFFLVLNGDCLGHSIIYFCECNLKVELGVRAFRSLFVEPFFPENIINFSFFRIRQDLISSSELHKLGLATSGSIRMELPRKLFKSSVYFNLIGISLDS